MCVCLIIFSHFKSSLFLDCEAVVSVVSNMALPGPHLTVTQPICQEKMLMLKNVALCLHTVCKCVHVRHEPFVTFMQQHGMQHPCPQEAQHTAFVCAPCKVAVQWQIDMSCVTSKCKMKLKWKRMMRRKLQICVSVKVCEVREDVFFDYEQSLAV